MVSVGGLLFYGIIQKWDIHQPSKLAAYICGRIRGFFPLFGNPLEIQGIRVGDVVEVVAWRHVVVWPDSNVNIKTE